MSNIYLTRHGESAANIGRATASSASIPLTDRGHEQSELLAQRFSSAGITPTHIVVSPFQRARATAAPLLLSHNMEPIVLDSLREIGYLAHVPDSTWEDRAAMRDTFWTNAMNDFDYRQGGETLHEFYGRARDSMAWLTRLAQETSGAEIVVVSHETTIAAMLSLARGVKREQFLRQLATDRIVTPPINNTQTAKLAVAETALRVVSDNLFQA
jgi:broad specificity phosphatase PhoE